MSLSPQPASYAHPVNWIRQLTRLQPAKWNWPRSVRAMIGIGLPLIIGTATHQLDLFLWVAMGFLLQISGERDNPYPVLFHRLLITTPLALAGLLLGYLSALPWEVVTLFMTTLAFASAVLSSYNSALSIGTMQMLMMGTVTLGNSFISHYWQPMLLALGGAVFYAVLLGIEAKLLRHRPEKQAVEQTLCALQALADHRAQGQSTGQGEAGFSTSLNNLYSFMLYTRSLAPSRNVNSEYIAVLIQRLDGVFAALESLDKPSDFKQVAQLLEQIIAAYTAQQKQQPELQGLESQVMRQKLEALVQTLWQNQYSLFKNEVVLDTKQKTKSWSVLLGELNPGKEVLLSASALALCMLLAYSLRWVDQASHWYWIPMTVILVMKPDLGSVFSRSVLRSLGTSCGVIIGGAVLHYVVPGPLFILIIVALACVMPWAGQRSYALMSLVITPLVLILIDYISPERAGINYAILRFEDTLLGGVIALIFGYLLWPKTNHMKFSHAFHEIRQNLALYLKATLTKAEDPNRTVQIHKMRYAVYGQIANFRSNLQKQLSDPPPASQEALAWFPLISSASRVANLITAYSINQSAQISAQELKALQQLADWIESGTVEKDITGVIDLTDQPDSTEVRLVHALVGELQHAKEMVVYHAHAKSDASGGGLAHP